LDGLFRTTPHEEPSCDLKEALKMPQKNKITGEFQINTEKKKKIRGQEKKKRKRKAN